MSKVYAANALTGGLPGALDSIDGDLLNDGDACLATIKDGDHLPYTLDATSGAAENSPYIIAPDVNAGLKRWILNGFKGNLSHVYAKQTTSAQSISSGSITTIVFDTEYVDKLAEYNPSTGVFTAKYAGIYSFSTMMLFQSVAWTADKQIYIRAYKNGTMTIPGEITWVWGSVTQNIGAALSGSIELAASDTLDMRIYHNRGSATSTQNAIWANFLTIDRIP